MGKVYLDREKNLCVHTNSGVFKSDGKHKLLFRDDEVFEISAEDLEQLMVIFSDTELRKSFVNRVIDEDVKYSGYWQDNFFHILTTDEAINKIKEEIKYVDGVCRKRLESYRLATDEIYNNKKAIEKHNELPWYKRFKKILWQD